MSIRKKILATSIGPVLVLGVITLLFMLTMVKSSLMDDTVRREGEKVTLPSVKLEATVTDANGNKRIGITFAELPDSLGMHLSMSVRTAVNYARLVWSSMGMLVSGQVGPQGPPESQRPPAAEYGRPFPSDACSAGTGRSFR